MWGLGHRLRVWKSKRRERKKEKTRSPGWRRVRDAFIVGRSCAACGGTDNLQVHHKQPFHLAPRLELDPTNLIVLCMGEHECHNNIGHGDDFNAYNPNVELDSMLCKTHPRDRPTIEAKAKLSRRY